MKYAMLPEQWEESIETLRGAGHELAELSDADFLIYNGDGSDFPLPLPENIKFVQIPSAGVDHLLDVMKETDVIWSNAAGVFDNTVAESTIALLLAQLHAHRYVNDTFSNYEEGRITSPTCTRTRLWRSSAPAASASGSSRCSLALARASSP